MFIGELLAAHAVLFLHSCYRMNSTVRCRGEMGGRRFTQKIHGANREDSQYFWEKSALLQSAATPICVRVLESTPTPPVLTYVSTSKGKEGSNLDKELLSSQPDNLLPTVIEDSVMTWTDVVWWELRKHFKLTHMISTGLPSTLESMNWKWALFDNNLYCTPLSVISPPKKSFHNNK